MLRVVYSIGRNENRIKIFNKKFVKKYLGECIILYNNKIFPLNEYFSIDALCNNNENEFEIFLIGFKKISKPRKMLHLCNVQKTEEYNEEYLEKLAKKEKLLIGEFHNKLLYFFYSLIIDKNQGNKNNLTRNSYFKEIIYFEINSLNARKRTYGILKLIYSNKKNANKIKIFTPEFVKKQRKKIRIVYNNKIYPLTEFLNIKQETKEFKIKLINLDGPLDYLTMLSAKKFSEDYYIFKYKKEVNKSIGTKYSYSEIYKIIYKINPGTKKIKIFDEKFVKNNQKKCYLKFKNQTFPLKERFVIDEINSCLIGKSDKLEILLMGVLHISDTSYMFKDCDSLLVFVNYKDNKNEYEINNNNLNYYTNLEHMFSGCSSLIHLLDVSKWDTSDVKSMSYMFNGCKSLLLLPDISTWNTKNLINASYIFKECKSLTFLPDISKWNTNKLKLISSMFSGCSSLTNLPDRAKWNINYVEIENLFEYCSSLNSLPDLSKWKIDNNINMNSIFDGCNSLTYLPDISKWNTHRTLNMSNIFNGCSSLLSIPDISNWDIHEVQYMFSLFEGCSSLKSLPDLSKWDTRCLEDISQIFEGCSSLISLPDISKWDTRKIRTFYSIFSKCSSLITLPDISKWIINSNDLAGMFSDCSSLISLPDISNWNIKNESFTSFMFNGCSSLVSLPDISKWGTLGSVYIYNMFSGCSSLISLPDFSKIKNIHCSDMSRIFEECISLCSFPDLSKCDITIVMDDGDKDIFKNCISSLNIPTIISSNEKKE